MVFVNQLLLTQLIQTYRNDECGVRKCNKPSLQVIWIYNFECLFETHLNFGCVFERIHTCHLKEMDKMWNFIKNFYILELNHQGIEIKKI
ncbi:hypothetical protein AUL54_08045 [Bacillus sp. SDLI1]|uniref:Uncharacterized protein n=1 Tax=Bacillus siamensis TaxID=659243 RepID=A0AAI8HRF8_9BACI|nr:hypothetical protein AUL54_08045 [Bacillus sp. SDLI1]AUJ78797.1 hypothetical protein CWD84_19295 [Bacillus siamensis]